MRGCSKYRKEWKIRYQTNSRQIQNTHPHTVEGILGSLLTQSKSQLNFGCCTELMVVVVDAVVDIEGCPGTMAGPESNVSHCVVMTTGPEVECLGG